MALIGILLIVAGVLFVLEDRKQKKEAERQKRFRNATYGLFKQHHWLDDDD